MYHFNCNYNAEKANPQYPVRAPLTATRNFRAFKFNYKNYNKAKKLLLHKYRSSKLGRQPTQGYYNARLPMCRIQPSPALHIKNNYLAVLAIS